MEINNGWIRASDGVRLYWKAWIPEKISAGVHLVHGYAEHIDRYQNVVDTLVPAGIAVFGTDHRGHGRSEGQRGHVERMQDYIDDERLFAREIVRDRLAPSPRFLLGHSMGSIISLAYVEQDAEDLAGLVLSGTGARPGQATDSPLNRLLARIGSRLFPRISIKFPLGPDFISRDPAVVRAYIDDPLTYDIITPRLAEQLTTTIIRNAQTAGTLSLPVLMQCGTEDISFSGQRELFEALGSPDKTFRFYEKLKHEVYNELPADRARVLGDLREWLEARL